MKILNKILASFLISILLFFQGLIYPIVVYALATDDTITTNEDAMVSTSFATLLGNDTDQITITSVQSAVNGSAVINGTNVEFTPSTNFNGAASYQYTSDATSSATVTVNVNAVNDPPSFDAIANQAAIDEDTSSQNVSITNVFPGPDDESGQTVTLLAASDNTSVIPNPTVSGVGATRTLTYTPVANANGTATITVTANDGESQNNTTPRTFTITVNAVSDSPVATGESVTAQEDIPVDIAVLVNDTDADGNIDPSTVAVTSVPSNGSTAVNPATGAVTYTPDANFNGVDSFTYSVADTAGATANATVNITVNVVNDTPSFTKGADQTILEDAGAQTVSSWATSISVGPANESSQTPNFIVTNNNNSLFSVQPVIAANGTLTYTPAANANGLATVTVSIHDDGGTANGGNDTSAAQTFMITVNPVSDSPVVTVTSPNGGEAWRGVKNLTWSAIDVDNDTLTIDVLYSANSGADWVHIANPENLGSYGIDTNALPDGNSYLFRIIASDGSLTAQDDSDAVFTIDKTAPTGTIVINGGAAYTNNQNVTLTLSANDALSGVTQMEVYKNTTPQGIETYSITRSLTLTSVDATKTVKVKFFDAAGNESSLFTTTIILDTTEPVIEVHGDITGIEATSPSGATVTYTVPNATDNFDATAPASCTPASDSTFTLGDTTVDCTKTDTAGNPAIPTSFTVTVQDTTAPVITVSGSNPVTVEINSTYADAGATATDDYDGDISGQISIDDFSVDTSQVGSYIVYYDVNDSSDNSAEQKTRTVNVVDTTPPEAPTEVSLTDPINNSNITEANVILTGFGEAFATVNYTISDENEGTADVIGTGAVADDGSITINANDVSSLSDGTITASITLTDATGNTGSAGTITATKDTVVPNTPPAPTVAGDNIINSSEYDDIVITGNAEAGSLVSVTLTDNSEFGNSISDTQQLGIDETVYAINLIGSDAYSEGCGDCGGGLQDGSIFVTVTAQDAVGNVSDEQSLDVTQDTSSPSITIDSYNTGPTNSDVTVTAFTEEGSTLNATSRTFSENGDFEFVATDTAGNTTSQIVTITNIDKDPPTVTQLGDGLTDYQLPLLRENPILFGATLIFSEQLSAAGKTAVENALTAGADKILTFRWGSEDISNKLRISTADATTATFANDVVVKVSDLAGNSAELLIVDSALSSTQKAPDSNGDVTVDDTNSEVVITDPDQEVDITIGLGTDNPTIDVSAFITGGTGTLPKITIDSEKADIAIPASTTVTSADPNWDGVIAAPKITTVTLPETAGETKTVSTAVEIGFSGAKLSFDKAVRILLPNQAGKRAGYTRPGTAFTEITNSCVFLDDQTAINADLVGLKEDCKIDSGLDLVIWTKHFTTFATYTQTTTSTSSSSSTSGGGGGGGGGDGLGCAVRDCSIHPAVQKLSLGVSVLASGLTGGFVSGVLGTSAEKIGEEIISQDTNQGQVQGEATSATPASKVQSSGGFFGAIGRLFGIIVGFFLHLFGR